MLRLRSPIRQCLSPAYERACWNESGDEAWRFAARCADARIPIAKKRGTPSLADQFDSIQAPVADSPRESTFSGDACQLLSATVRDYLENGRALEDIAEVTARLCREAHARGLSAEETLSRIRSTLGGILAACPLTSSDKAGLVALAIDQCVHAFYHRNR